MKFAIGNKVSEVKRDCYVIDIKYEDSDGYKIEQSEIVVNYDKLEEIIIYLSKEEDDEDSWIYQENGRFFGDFGQDDRYSYSGYNLYYYNKDGEKYDVNILGGIFK